ncbi:MAG: hypothetical protein U0414_19545 [Polyangiaceae bacterium]
MKITLELELGPRTRRWVRRAVLLGAPVVAMAVSSLAVGKPAAFSKNESLSSVKMNANFTDLDDRLARFEAPKVFEWSSVDAVSGVETDPAEGVETVTFANAGTYRVTLNAQVIKDAPNPSSIRWALGGSATRLDPFDMDGQQAIYIPAPDQVSRQVVSTVVYVKAQAGQTLDIHPFVSVTFSSGTFHEAHFGYGVEYVGAAQP